jgi:hypothetical protein
MFFHTQYFIVKRIKALGGGVIYDYVSDTGKPSQFLFSHMIIVFFDKPVKNKDLLLLQDLPHLEYVFLRNPDITDEGLNIIIDLPNLNDLGL